jgi:hypothetical protein
MIAPRQKSDEIDFAEGLRAARRMVATVMLEKSPPIVAPPSWPVPAWQAWLFTAWILLVAAAYGAHWLGLY